MSSVDERAWSIGADGSGSRVMRVMLRGFRTRVSCCVVARLPGICPPRLGCMVRSGHDPQGFNQFVDVATRWESCRSRIAWGRVRASRDGPLRQAADLAVA